MIKVIKDFLSKEEFLILKSYFIPPSIEAGTNNLIPFYYSPSILRKNKNNDLDSYQFTHIFYEDTLIKSNNYQILFPILRKLKVIALVKAKANVTTRTKEKVIHGYHCDVNFKCKTAVYYINSNNGETIFENGKKIKSVENTLVEFPSNLRHSGTSHTSDEHIRVVLNFNYFNDSR